MLRNKSASSRQMRVGVFGLVTIAAAVPKNLVHMVVQNGTYEANGSHPIPNTKVEFAAMARTFR